MPVERQGRKRRPLDGCISFLHHKQWLKTTGALAAWLSVGTSSHPPKGCGFDTVRWGACGRQPTHVSLTHACFSLLSSSPASPTLPRYLSKINKYIPGRIKKHINLFFYRSGGQISKVSVSVGLYPIRNLRKSGLLALVGVTCDP